MTDTNGITHLGDGRLRLSPGWYWVTIGRAGSEGGNYAAEQLANLQAMGYIAIRRKEAALWSKERPGMWHLFEVLRPTDYQLMVGTWGPAKASNGPFSTPDSEGQEWEPPPSWVDHIAEGAEEALEAGKQVAHGAFKTVLPWVVGLGFFALIISARRK
jgi:hypothetical protein